MRAIIILSLTILATTAFSQRLLQIEKLNSPKTLKFYPGNEITFQTSDGQWYTRVIEDVNYENNWILFVDGHTPISDIITFKTFKNKRWSQNIGNQLMMFAPLWAAYKGVAKVVDPSEQFGKPDYIIMGTSAAIGAFLRLVFKSKTYKFSKKYRLRILDLNIK